MTETNALFRQADIPERYKWKFVDDFRMAAPDGTRIDLAGLRFISAFTKT